MASKLWEKNVKVDHDVEAYTVGRDQEMDLYLAPYDVLGSMAHITMLQSIGLLEADELDVLLAELRNIYSVITDGDFVIEEGIEDVHSQVELMLTRKLGDVGKKIHSGRSRNDQVLVDLKLFTRSRIEDVAIAVLPDHPTPCRLRTHTSNAVPFLLYYKGIEADNVESFDEFSVKDGGYNHLVGDEFIKNLITKY